ncbi:cytochrome P450 2U1-like [Uloborus diversus]|uniref:cytochrome P450 2U1-like n=1 Tax=Uloborus diversus TaxID=327109 RepID=UPI002409121B|nr:cytochrome P450 2U1-like [Uloborus diversus]
MDAISLILVPILVLLISVWISVRRKGNNPLPGPLGLPFVGYIPFMTSKPYVKLAKLAKRYGPVYSVRLGGREIIILTDFKSIKEAFASDAFMGRPKDLPFDLSETTKKTGAFHGKEWKDQKAFALHMLRDLGFGKTKMEEHLREEIEDVLNRMDELVGKPTRLADILSPSVTNNIGSLLFGKRRDHSDPKLTQLQSNINDIGRLAGATTWQLFFPWIGAILGYFKIGDKGRLKMANQYLQEYVDEEIKEHLKSLDSNNIRDFIDGYLLQMEKKSKDPSSTFHRDVLIDVGRGFFAAGSETAWISVNWFLLICAAFPEVQKKIHEEIMETLGHERFPTRADYMNMPYTEAIIMEINRWITTIPLNIMRSTLEDTELNGYFIPKDSYVLADLWAVHHDKTLWGKDADIFKPERFLSEDGKKVIKPEYYIPFSIGKCQCPGKIFAEVELFLYDVAILQRFEVSLPLGKKADLEGVLGITLQPKRQELILKRR